MLEIFIFLKKFLTLLFRVASKPKTLIFFEEYLKFEIFTSKQYIFELGKNLENAAAEAPAKEPISKILNY